jgi:hypothetical protein
MGQEPEKGETIERTREDWSKWYRRERDQLTEDIGHLQYSTEDKQAVTHPSWVLRSYQVDRMLLDMLNDHHLSLLLLLERLANAEIKLGALEKKLNDYEPTVSELKKYFERIRGHLESGQST